MQNDHSMVQLLKSLLPHITSRRRKQFALVFLLMIFSTLAEVISIGSVMPFLAVLADPIMVFEHPAAQPIVKLLEITSPDGLVIPLVTSFGVAVVISGFTRMLLIWANIKFSNAIGADLSISLYDHMLNQPYLFHVNKNSSELITGISKADGIVGEVITPILTITTSVLILISALILILSTRSSAILFVSIVFIGVYYLITRVTRKRQRIDSGIIARESTKILKAVQEGLGGIRDVLIDGNQNIYREIFRKSDIPIRHAKANNSFLGAIPRYMLETIGIVFIILLAYRLFQASDNISTIIPIIGIIVLGFQRILPIMQQGYEAWVRMRGSKAAFHDVVDLFDAMKSTHLSIVPEEKLPFKKDIKLKQLVFKYSKQTPRVLNDIDLTITKGSRVGIIGKTGCGKSTLLDVIMGLLQPTTGSLEVDNVPITINNYSAWQSNIVHVPQSIYLSDSTIEENIAFGVPVDMINHERIRQVANQAQISEVIENWPQQYQTFVGERGIRLSGGQRQRIGIARALYKYANVIILDEATSALDSKTEESVMQNIENISDDITIIIVAHRLSTLKDCTLVVELDKGRIVRMGDYEEIVSC